MPVRRETARAAKRLNDRVIAELFELIRQGIPWNVDNMFRVNRGVADLRGLVTGHFYFTELCEDGEGDEETKHFLYESVKAELVPTHAHYRPASRPWAWWKWDAPEMRRLVGRYCLDPKHEDDCDGAHDADARLPAFEDPGLQGIVSNYFGAPSIYDGYAYEAEFSYLERLDLLFDEEKAIFEKYESVINVHIAQGGRGECAPCWERAREIAKGIDFDLETAIKHFEFWVPGELYLPCEHSPHNADEGIFVDAD